MAAPDYVTLVGIRKEAGLHHEQKVQVLTGSADGSNKIFYAPRTFIVDRNYDDALNSDDVVVYVNNVAVTVEAVNGITGAITLVAAPANGATVKATYAYSVASDDEVEGYREEAQDWLNRKVKSYLDPTTLTEETFPKIWRAIVRLYAAGLMLIRDYGSSADTDLSSKDGYEKRKTAKAMLEDWVVDQMDDADTSTPVSTTVKTDGNIFARNDDLDGTTMSPTPDTDEFFHHDNG